MLCLITKEAWNVQIFKIIYSTRSPNSQNDHLVGTSIMAVWEVEWFLPSNSCSGFGVSLEVQWQRTERVELWA